MQSAHNAGVRPLLSTGCGALLLLGGAGTSAIAFATGELRSTEPLALAELDAAGAVERWWATTAALDGHELASTWYDAGDAWRGTVLTAPVHAEVAKDFAGMGVHHASTLASLRATPQACAVPGLWTVAQKLKGGWANLDGRSYAKKSDAAQRARELLALHGVKNVALLSDKGAVVPVPQPTREAE